FASKSHRDAFTKNPTKFEVQLGGGCGKMAELAGRGSTERYWIYKGKLFIFASDGCRTGFQSNPEGHIEKDDPKIQTTPAESKRGRELLDKAAKWSGIDGLGKMGSVAFLQESVLKQGDQSYDVKGITRLSASGDYYDVTTYNGAGYANQIQKGKAIEINSKGVADVHVPTWKRALERQRARNLAYLLIARKYKGMTVKFDGAANGIASVVANIDGSTSTLWIEESTGKVISQINKGRNRLGIIGDVQREFTEYQIKDGVTMPVAWTATFNGQDSPIHDRNPMKLEIRKK
ncbi:MAG: hypothetical protein H7Y17_10045, partial [Chlorobia bacterium]|nr:hypothetical protein [Fimbriimonadaceae bacterium]